MKLQPELELSRYAVAQHTSISFKLLAGSPESQLSLKPFLHGEIDWFSYCGVKYSGIVPHIEALLWNESDLILE